MPRSETGGGGGGGGEGGWGGDGDGLVPVLASTGPLHFVNLFKDVMT